MPKIILCFVEFPVDQWLEVETAFVTKLILLFNCQWRIRFIY